MPIFSNCRDPSLVALRDVGFNVVRLPRVDLLPTQLLVARGGMLRPLGELPSVFTVDPNGAPVPPIKPDQPGPNISGKKSNDLNIGIGLDILGGLISALGGSTLGINMAYARASSIQFTYNEVKRCDTELALVDQFLGSAPINRFARAAREMLDHDNVYVVTSVIKSNTITVSAKDSNKQSLGIKLPVIKEAIGANLDVSGNGEMATEITYKGAVPLAFGFQAVRLIFDGETYRSMKIVKAGEVVAESADGAEPAPASAFAPVELMLGG